MYCTEHVGFSLTTPEGGRSRRTKPETVVAQRLKGADCRLLENSIIINTMVTIIMKTSSTRNKTSHCGKQFQGYLLLVVQPRIQYSQIICKGSRREHSHVTLVLQPALSCCKLWPAPARPSKTHSLVSRRTVLKAGLWHRFRQSVVDFRQEFYHLFSFSRRSFGFPE